MDIQSGLQELVESVDAAVDHVNQQSNLMRCQSWLLVLLRGDFTPKIPSFPVVGPALIHTLTGGMSLFGVSTKGSGDVFGSCLGLFKASSMVFVMFDISGIRIFRLKTIKANHKEVLVRRKLTMVLLWYSLVTHLFAIVSL